MKRYIIILLFASVSYGQVIPPFGVGDISSVWNDSTGDVSALTAAAGDSFNASAADSTIPWEVDTTAAPTTEGMAIWDSDDDILTIGDGAATVYMALGASDGDALAGDSATAFFDAGTLEPARGGSGAGTFTDGGVLLGSAAAAFTAMAVLGDGAIIIGDGAADPVPLTAFTSSTGTLKHESGGLEANVSGYTDGLYGMATGVTTDIDTIAEVETAIGGTNILINTEIDGVGELLAITDYETGTGALTFATAPTFTTSIKLTGANADPAGAGTIVYDNDVTDLDGGSLAYYDDDEVKYLAAFVVVPGAAEDDYVLAYDQASDLLYFKADADTGGTTPFDTIGNPTGTGSVEFDDGETQVFSTAQDAAASFLTIRNTNAAVGNQTYILDLDYSADTTEDNADFIIMQDAGSTLIVFEEEGKITMTPSGVDDAEIISITPGALTAADVEWDGIAIDGAALDPGDVDNRIHGIHIDMSGVSLAQSPHIDGIEIQMPNMGDAIHINEGIIVMTETVASTAYSTWNLIDVLIDANDMVATSDVHVLDVEAGPDGFSGEIAAVATHEGVDVIHQYAGTFEAMDQAGADCESIIVTGGPAYEDGINNKEVFVANGDSLFIGASTGDGSFEEIEVLMTTDATRDCQLTFNYYNGGWVEFFPSDGTDGFQHSGIIAFDSDDLTGWDNNADPEGSSADGYWIQIVRGVAADPGTPTPITIQTGNVTLYYWDDTGAVDLLSMEADTVTVGGATVVAETVATGAMIFGDSTPDADGEFGFDTDGDGATVTSGVINAHDGTEAIFFFGSAGYPGGDNQILKYDAGTNKVVWEADADTGGATDYENIGDPGGSGSIAFDAAEAGVYTSGDDEWVGITISNTQAALTGDSELLTLAFTDDGDTNAHYLIMSDAAGTQQLEFIQNAADVVVTTAGDLKFVAGGGDFDFADDTLTTTGTMAAAIVDTPLIQDAATIHLRPSGDDNDYVTVKTAADISYIGRDDDDDLLKLESGALTVAGTITGVTSFTIGAAALLEEELEKLDAVTNGTVAANKAVVADASLDVDFGTGDIDVTDLVVDGTANIIGTTTLGTATSAAGNLTLFDEGLLTLYEDGDNFSVTMDCQDGEAVMDLQGGLDVSGVITSTSPVFTTPDLGTPSALVGTNISGTGASFTAGIATHVTVTDNEAANEEGEVAFVEDASGPGNVGLESDSGFTYNPSTGSLTAAEYIGGGGSLTGVDAATGDSATDFFDAGEIADARISDTLTSSSCTGTAAIATDVTITDNENGAEENEVAFVENAAGPGNNGLESDSGFTYNPSTGTLTAAEYVGGGVGLTGLTGVNITANTVNEPTLETTNAAGAGTDNYLLSYNHAGTNFTWVVAGAGDMLKATYDSGVSGGVDILTTVDSTYASDYVLLTGTAVGTAAPKTDGALTYDATSGTLAATEFSGGGGSLTGIDAATGDSATAFFDAGTIEHEYGGLQADVSGWTGLFGITGADTSVEVDTFAELDTAIADKSLVNQADGATWTGTHDFGGADLEIPQASPGVPGVDGGIEMDFTDGKLVMQHSSAHAELGGSVDVAIAGLIDSREGTFATPDSLQSEIDNWPFMRVDATKYPHGIVITSITLTVSGDTSYAINVENWDDHDTINGANPTIDAVSYTAPSTGEVVETAITYATIAAGQIIQIDLPTTDVSWIQIKIEFYEPAA